MGKALGAAAPVQQYGGVVRIGEIMPRGRVADCRRSGVQASNRPAGAALSESQRSESKNNMIAGGNHTIMQQ